MDSQFVKSPVRLQRFKELELMPRFEYGDIAESLEGACRGLGSLGLV